jgi:hypothetical protein
MSILIERLYLIQLSIRQSISSVAKLREYNEHTFVPIEDIFQHFEVEFLADLATSSSFYRSLGKYVIYDV